MEIITQAEYGALFENSVVKVVRHLPVKRLKTVVRAYRSLGSHVVFKPELDRKNEYVVTAQLG